MKLLSAKNKRTGITALAMLAGLIIIASIVRATKAGLTGIGDIAKQVIADIKSFISFPNVVALLITAGGLLYLLPLLSIPGGVTIAVALGTLTTGAAVVSTFNSTWVPKYLFYTAATQLTGVKITVQGDGVIFDSDANGLNHVGVSRVAAQVTNSYIIRLTNGLISGKNVIWEFTNSAAQTPVIYVSNDETPPDDEKAYLQFLRQTVLASSGQNFSDFATISMPSLAAADVVNVLYRDGTQQQLNRADIQGQLSYYQNIVNTPIYTIDNFAQKIKMVNIIAAAQQTVYVQRWVPVTGDGMINQSLNR